MSDQVGDSPDTRLLDTRIEAALKRQQGGGGPHDPGLGTKVIRLEEWAKLSDQRMGRIEDVLGRVDQRLSSMPTTNGLWGMVATVIAVSLTVIALVAGIFAYRQDQILAISDRALGAAEKSATAPVAGPPVIIHMPPQATTEATDPAKTSGKP